MPPTFFCSLCNKGYARSNELEAHENSYDHQHRKRNKESKQLMRSTAAKSNRKKEASDIMSSNIQSSGPEKKGGGFKPIGGAAVIPAPDDTPVKSDVGLERKDSEKGRRKEAELEFVEVQGPIPWEELGDVGELVDLDTMRPKAVQRMVDAQREHMKIRRDPGLYKDIWTRVDASKGRVESESPPRAMGLGLGAS